MKSWKKRWKAEIDKIVPPLNEEVKNAPIPASGNVEYNCGATAALSRNKSKVMAAVAVFLAAVCAIIACFWLFRPQKDRSFIFAIEINPAISIVTDGSGTVTGVISSNADADVILSSEGAIENIKGKNIEEAAVYYVDTAAKLGYLDLSVVGSAVRISAYETEDADRILSDSEIALKKYFVSHGAYAVVVTESVSGAEFYARSGILSAQTYEETAEYISGQKVLYTERESEGLDEDGLQELYGNIILKEGLVNVVENSLKNNIEKLKKNSEDIQRLFELYYDIYTHEDNPATFLKDYWEVKKYYGNELDGEFAQLVLQMDEALEKYAGDYGVEIKSYSELYDAAVSYAEVSVEQIAVWLEDFTYELFRTYISELSEILKITGIFSDETLSLMVLPETAEEYYDKVYTALETEYSYRLQEYGDIYAENREPISMTDYENYLAGIKETYGSLSEYWQSIKN